MTTDYNAAVDLIGRNLAAARGGKTVFWWRSGAILRAMGLAKLALVLGAALAMAVATGESAAGGRSGGGRSGGGHAHSGSGHHSHFHHRGAVFFGGYIYTGPYYSYPGYYYPVPLYYPGPADPYWYYCRAANAYYPYVQNCPGGWERYLPSPQSPLS